MRISVVLKHGIVEIDWPQGVPLPAKGDELHIDRHTVDAVKVTGVKFSVYVDSQPADVRISVYAE